MNELKIKGVFLKGGPERFSLMINQESSSLLIQLTKKKDKIIHRPQGLVIFC